MEFKTLRELYLHSVNNYAERRCSSMYGGESLTYGGFSRRVDKVIAILRDGGLRRGDKVALLSNNMPNWAVCYFAAVVSGLVIVPILPDYAPDELDMILKHSEAKAIFVSDKLFSKVSKNTAAQMNLVVRTMNLGIISHGLPKVGADQLKKALANIDGREMEEHQVWDDAKIAATLAAGTAADSPVPAPAEPFKIPEPDDLAAIIYTSGTTSKPKGVMLTHHNLASQIMMDMDLFPISKDDVFLSILPLSHTYECTIGMLFPFSAGAQVVYLDKLPTASTLMPAMREVRPTIMLSVPLIIEKIYRSQVLSRFKHNSVLGKMYTYVWFRKLIHRIAGNKLRKVFGGRLRFFGIGGAKLDEDTERFLMEGGFPYGIGYGLTETAPLLAGGIPGKIKFRSTGPMLKAVQVRLENVDPQTGEGEIVVLSPSTMLGYYKNQEATNAVFTEDGWFRTRDRGIFDQQGNLYIKGRVDTMIVGASGENIYPEEIESVINSHFLVTDSIVKQEQGKLVAMVRFDKDKIEGESSSGRGFKEEFSQKIAEMKKEVIDYVNSKVSRSSHISDIEEQETDFEKTPTLKIKRFKYTKEGQDNSSKKEGAKTEEKTDSGE